MDDQQQKGPSGMQDTSQIFLLDAIVRKKIFECRYWKEECFGLTAESLVDKAIVLNCVGGTYSGTRKATSFLCLVAKLLQISPEKEIIYEFIKNKDYKYVNIMGLFYLRLVGKPKDVYQILELFYSDYRKIRVRKQDGSYEILHVDEIVDQMIHNETLFDVLLPRLPKRWNLEDQKILPQRISAIQDELEFVEQQVVHKDKEEETQPQKEANEQLPEIKLKQNLQDVKQEEVRKRSRSHSKSLSKSKKIKKDKKKKYKFHKKDKKERK